ncbi:MAG: T9SS type A sorting domain-containing protein [Bacteroidales bacterium]|nr:T9SS type A sorting domain-containing protein [Bacteroidales bacterium]
MLRGKIFISLLLLFVMANSFGQVTAHLDRKMAIYLNTNENTENYQADISSVKQMAAVSGLPYIITTDFLECLEYGMFMFSSPVLENSLSTSQKTLLVDYVENGGCVVFGALMDPDLYEFAGLDAVLKSRQRYQLSFDSSLNTKEFRWIDEDFEWNIQLGEIAHIDIFNTYGYEVSEGEVMGRFEDGKSGLVRTSQGDGLVYSFGFSWRDLIVRNLVDRDFDANRWYSNHFEASTDVIMLLLRGIFTQAVPHAVWLSSVPYDSKAVMLITHDVCSHTAHLFSNDFAKMEYERGISATYNITTHQFIDDINGDNYSSHLAQMKLLLHYNHVIGSHGYGHFPDFHSSVVFPLGEELSSASNYHPHYSFKEGCTVDGTVYGELGVSKILLENDLNIDVEFFRSGHLAVNKEQFTTMNELGYSYSSSYTAADLLTGFPFYVHAKNESNGIVLPIIEMGVTISDVFGSHGEPPIDEFNWLDKAAIWISVTESYANNHSMICFLVHPNRYYKLDALEYVLDHISPDIYIMEFSKYADFWEEKNNIRFSSLMEGSTLKIFASEELLNNEAFSFVIDSPDQIEQVNVYNENGDILDFYQKDYYHGTTLFYQKSFSEIENKKLDISMDEQLLLQNFPNPFSQFTTIEYHISESAYIQLQVLDMYGRVVMELVNEQQEEGIYQLDVNAKDLKSGIYFYRIHVQGAINYFTATKKMIIK